MRRLFSSIACTICLVFLASCSDDDTKDYPPLITDFVVANVDASKKVSSVKLDNGASYPIQSQQISAEVADTLYRCVASYTLADGTMSINSLQSIFSPHPDAADSLLQVVYRTAKLDTLPHDPMKVVSMWKSGGYINMQLGLMTTGKGTHAYAFSEDSVGHYSLVHMRPEEDAESYTQKVYMSMPIPEGVEHPTFTVYTYDGIFTKTF